MSPRYIRPEVNYQEEIPNGPFAEPNTPVPAGDVSLRTSKGSVGLGDLTVVQGKLRIGAGSNDSGNHDYGVF